MEMDDYWLLMKGWNDKQRHHLEMMRLQTALIVEGFVGGGKGTKFVMNAIQLPGEKKDTGVGQKHLDMLKKFREKEALRRANEKINKNG